MYVANEKPEELKNPEKAAKPLRIDHSRVHYENGRLTEMLHANLTEISANQHRQLMSRNNEIKEIRQSVEDYKAIIKTQKRTNKGVMRPQTSSVYLSKRKRTPSPSIKRPTRSSAVTPTVGVNDESDSDESTVYDDDPFRYPRTKSAPAVNRKSSVVSAVSNSSFRSTSVKSGSTVFQTQLGTEPQWPTPNQSRRPVSLGNGSGKHMYKEPEPPFVQFQNEWDEGDGFKMICGGNQTLSRRQLKQLTNVDRFIHDERRKRYARYYEALIKNRDERNQLDARVKDFIKSLLDRKCPSEYSA
ncbi:hypothetical protein LOTGIDRAFT_154394 [Lottia gigantea]|uniref:Uncharacterized protein n=1 Tax=Lottia gigantea TaxID=225164 RepID=V3ZY01_LOTGI|nr:hypothetical protein LOTGIDRAFT_154394 [Lottia gigantea]ESO89297.1 hypothetical protein LOTGIDRAFT_154394 [Lottia gigantea]